MQQHVAYRIITHPHLDAGASIRRRAWATLLAIGGCRMDEDRVAAMQAAAGMAEGNPEQQAGADCLAPAQPDRRVAGPPLTATPARPFSTQRLRGLIAMIRGWLGPHTGDSYRTEIEAQLMADRLRREHGATVNLERWPSVICMGGVVAAGTDGGTELFRRWADNAEAILTDAPKACS
ncbi:hypothetical protein [Profundibacter sp.]